MSNGSIIKRDGKRGVAWLLKYDGPRDPATGKRRQLYKTVKGTRKDAEVELRRLLGSIDGGTHIDPHKITVAEWIETWLRDHAAGRVSEKTIERYGELLRLHVAPVIGGAQLLRLSAPTVQAMYTTLRAGVDAATGGKRALAEQTILHVHRVLSQALATAVRQRLVPRNPIDDVAAPRPRAGAVDGEKEIRALEREELDRLLRGFKGRTLFPIVAVAAATGMRRGEVLALRWSEVDLDGLTIKVERSLEDTKAKGVRVKAPKTRGSRRTIGIDPGLAALLKVEQKRQAELAISLGLRKEDREGALVFPSSPLAPATPRRPRAVTKEFACQVAALGFKHVRLHDLRHTHATLLLLAGVPINAVAERLGHSSPVVTLTVYGHVLRRAEDKAVAVSGSLLAAALSEI